ncbi:hypothetical protein [Thiothrix unzii]|uniref:Uncharacterized protein n=1 Tax=Thiothrix unzii TaxID=111769 RepID=A0A975F7Y1_9GAMM|nr:hypothetical protein [Thiothrix unzii]QTR52673.1 hypothetical protein J9260_13300 [Thiothrix unzii]
MEIETSSHPRKWAAKQKTGEREQLVNDLNSDYLVSPQIMADLKSKQEDLRQGVENSKANIETQNQIIVEYEQSLTDSTDNYAAAVINENQTAIVAIEEQNAETTRQIRLAQVRKNANQLVVDKIPKYIYVITGMINALDVLEVRRNYQVEVAAFAATRAAFITAFKDYIQRCENICPGVKRFDARYNPEETVRVLLQDLGYSPSQLLIR